MNWTLLKYLNCSKNMKRHRQGENIGFMNKHTYM